MLCDFLGHLDVVGGQVNIEGDKWLASPDHGGTRGAQLFGAEIWGSIRVLHDRGLELLILAAPDVRQIDSIGAGGGSFVQIDRDPQLPSHSPAELARQFYALVHGDPMNWDEGHNIGGAEARVFSLVKFQVDQLGSL